MTVCLSKISVRTSQFDIWTVLLVFIVCKAIVLPVQFAVAKVQIRDE